MLQFYYNLLFLLPVEFCVALVVFDEIDDDDEEEDVLWN